MSPEEKERRLRLVEHGIKTEFWKSILDQTVYCNGVDMQEVIDLHWNGKHEEAARLAVQIRAKQDILKEPISIIRNVKPVFDEWDGKKWVRKSLEKLGKVFSVNKKTEVKL